MYNLFILVFLILLSPSVATITLEVAVLVNNLLMLMSYSAVAFALLFLSVNKENWNVKGGTVPLSPFTFYFSKSQD
jgi:hypothetical protein